MSELTQFIKQKIADGVSAGDAVDAVVEAFPEAKEEEIIAAVEAAEKSFKLTAAIEFKKVEAERKAAEEAHLGEIIDHRVEAATKSALEKIQLPQPAHTPKFKSFMADIAVTSDNSWREDFSKMLVAMAGNNDGAARQLSENFIKSSKFQSKAVLRGDATTGSYAVPDEFLDRVFVTAQLNSHIFDAATKITMNSDTMYLLGSGNVTFTSVTDQTTALTESEPTLTQGTLSLIDVGAYSLVHENLISDAFVNIPELLAGAFGRGFASHVKQATTVWNSGTTGDKFNGIYSTSGIGSVTVADAGGSISYADIIDLIFAVDEAYRADCHFEMNDRELKKIMKIVDTQGRPIFYDSKAQNGQIGTILGYPVYTNNQMPITMDSSTGARTGGDTATILFGSAREVQIGIKGGFSLEASREFKFTNRQITYRGYTRWAQALMSTLAWARLVGIK